MIFALVWEFNQRPSQSRFQTSHCHRIFKVLLSWLKKWQNNGSSARFIDSDVSMSPETHKLIWSNWRAFAFILVHFSYLQDLLIDCILQQHIHRDLWHANIIKRRSDRCSGRNSTLWLAACNHVLFYFLTLLWESDFLITACPDLWHKTSSSWNTHWRSAALNCLGFSSSLRQSKLTNCRSETKLRHLMSDHVEMTAAHTHSGTFFRVDSRSVSKNCFVLLPSMLSSYTIFCYFGKLPTLRISSATEQRFFFVVWLAAFTEAERKWARSGCYCAYLKALCSIWHLNVE